MCKSRRSAFTLIEVLIVVIIMAVLAATIIPQFASSTTDAKMSNVKFNLHTIRSQLELYKEHHLSKYPVAATSEEFSDRMTQKTTQAGTVDATGAYGPYIEGKLPLNPFNNSNTVAIVTGDTEPTAATGSTDGWQYNAAHGWFYPNNEEYFKSTGKFDSPN